MSASHEHDHDHDHGSMSPEDDAALALDLLIKGDLPHGAFHLAGALAGDPQNPEWLALADRYIATADKPLALAPMGAGSEPTWYGIAAFHALILARTGRAAQGIELILSILEQKPETGYLSWITEWLQKDPELGPTIDRKPLMTFFGGALQQFPGGVIKDKELRAALEPIAAFGELAIGDPDPEPLLCFTRAAINRKLGRLKHAGNLALRAWKVHHDYYTANALAEVYRAADDEENYLKWQEKALDHDKANVPARLDLGDYFFHQGKAAQALRWYEEALVEEPQHPWALPSAYAARYQLHGGDWLQKLQKYAAKNPRNDRAAALVAEASPYIGALPPPQEALLNVVSQILEVDPEQLKKSDGPTNAKVTLSAIEAPSSRLACKLDFDAHGLNVEMPITVTSIQKPDPRVPRRRVNHQIWKYIERRRLGIMKELTTDPIPSIGEPSPRVAKAIGSIAASEYHRTKWFETAKRLVRKVQPEVGDLLGSMVHPPDLPEGAPAALWLQRVQVAAALCVAAIDSTPWESSQRREVLFDLLDGPMDWTVDAAIIALTELAQSEPAIAEEVGGKFFELLKEQPRPGHVCYYHALIHCLGQLPGMPKEVTDLANELQAELREDR